MAGAGKLKSLQLTRCPPRRRGLDPLIVVWACVAAAAYTMGPLPTMAVLLCSRVDF